MVPQMGEDCAKRTNIFSPMEYEFSLVLFVMLVPIFHKKGISQPLPYKSMPEHKACSQQEIGA